MSDTPSDAERARALCARVAICFGRLPEEHDGRHSSNCTCAVILAAFGEVRADAVESCFAPIPKNADGTYTANDGQARVLARMEAAMREGRAAGLAFAKHVVKEGYEPDECEECANVKASINSEGGKP